MDPHLWLAFLGAVVVLMLIPGPNVALIVSNSLRDGVRHGLITMAGTNLANGMQAGLAGLGLCTILGQIGPWFSALRWIGVAYLICLGIREWRSRPADPGALAPEADPPGRVFRRAFMVGATNPKTLFFYGALFPQFVDARAPIGPQIGTLIATLLVTAVTVDTGWALLADRLRPVLAGRARVRRRLTGGLMIGAGAALGLAHTG